MASERPCTIHDDGKYYNLNSLKSKTDYELTLEGGHQFVLNVCQSVSHRLWNLDLPDPENVAGFVRQDRGDLSVGSVNTTLAIRDSNPLLLLTGGSFCPTDDEIRASTTIQFLCDVSVVGAGKPTLLSQFPKEDEDACSFVLQWCTPVACPTSEPGGIYSYFAFILASLVAFLLLYLIPQFSLMSLKYHVSASLEALKDILESFRQGSQSPRQGNTRVNRHWSMKPHSHQPMHWGASPDEDGSIPPPGCQHFDMERQAVVGTVEERVPIMQSHEDDALEPEDTSATPTIASTRKGMDLEGVTRL